MNRQRPERDFVRALVFAFLAVLGGTGCSQTADSACAGGAEASCAWLERCNPVSLRTLFGDRETCAARTRISCLEQFLPGSNAGPEDIVACTGAVSALSCDGLPGEGRECHPKPGARGSGTACGNDWQCQSTFCKKSGDKPCGSCAARAKIGELCDGSGCEFGATCAPTSLTERRCVVPTGEGSICVSGFCQSGLFCNGGVCTKPMFLGVGTACDPTRPWCDPHQGLYCHAATRVCTQVKYPGPGEACGDQQDGTIALCSAGSQCPAGMPTNPLCIAPAKDGEACNLSMNLSCLQPAVCRNSVCTVPDPGACM